MIEWYFVLLFIYVDCTCYKYCLKPSSLGPTDTGLFDWYSHCGLFDWYSGLHDKGIGAYTAGPEQKRSCFSQKWSCYSQWNVCVDKHILKKISVKQHSPETKHILI